MQKTCHYRGWTLNQWVSGLLYIDISTKLHSLVEWISTLPDSDVACLAFLHLSLSCHHLHINHRIGWASGKIPALPSSTNQYSWRRKFCQIWGYYWSKAVHILQLYSLLITMALACPSKYMSIMCNLGRKTANGLWDVFLLPGSWFNCFDLGHSPTCR